MKSEVRNLESIKEYSELVSLFDKQLQFAQNIQKKIIPQPSEFVSDTYHLYAMLKPFRKVGGDFYDFHNLDEDNISLILADATGHGIDAAMITSMVKLIYSYAMENELVREHPSMLMQRMERDIEKQLTSTYFSAFALVLDPGANTLRYANAGHPSAILVGDDITLLKPSLPLVGLHQLMSSINYQDITVPFKNGDKFIIFTDGLIDAQNTSNELFSMERLTEIVKKHMTHPINTICQEILKEYNLFTEGTDDMDDVCLLGIEYDD